MSMRFAWIVAGHRRGSDPICDVDLLDAEIAGVVPTVGSIVPGWVLLVPRQTVLNMSQLPRHAQQIVLRLAGEVSILQQKFSSNITIFEHGAAHTSSSIGCGVDQAHLHLLPSGIDLLTPATSNAMIEWHSVDPADPWATVDVGREYYLVINGGCAYIGYPKAGESQFFRKLIAAAVGKSEAWDYRLSPFYENAQATVCAFREQRPALAA